MVLFNGDVIRSISSISFKLLSFIVPVDASMLSSHLCLSYTSLRRLLYLSTCSSCLFKDVLGLMHVHVVNSDDLPHPHR